MIEPLKYNFRRAANDAASMITQKDPFGAVCLTRSVVTTIYSSTYW